MVRLDYRCHHCGHLFGVELADDDPTASIITRSAEPLALLGNMALEVYRHNPGRRLISHQCGFNNVGIAELVGGRFEAPKGPA